MTAPILASQWPKARFTVAQIWALIEKGLIDPDAKFELLDGEVVPVAPKGPLHEGVRLDVMNWLRRLPQSLVMLAETTLYLDDRSFLEPDYVVFDAGLGIEDLTPSKVRLRIEVSNGSWPYDIGEKAERYAKHGVQEYWAINAPKRLTRVHRGPKAEGWSETTDIAAGKPVAPLCAPETPLRLEAKR